MSRSAATRTCERKLTISTVPIPAAAPPAPETTTTKIGPVLIAFAVGTAVAIGLGVYGKLHDPTG